MSTPTVTVLASAGDDILEPIDQLAAALRAAAPRRVRWTYEPRPDLKHATIYRGIEARALREALPPRSGTRHGR